MFCFSNITGKQPRKGGSKYVDSNNGNDGFDTRKHIGALPDHKIDEMLEKMMTDTDVKPGFYFFLFYIILYKL